MFAKVPINPDTIVAITMKLTAGIRTCTLSGFIRVHKITQSFYDLNKLFFCSSHYSSPIEYSLQWRSRLLARP